ncbi:MAG TPA: tripartite tricarboxylate transporter substrate binding protein [Burkholderiales bacterium]|nr:tripartite tricarboxylate transporter substrate binding protein [Burkholderiales bacterium]
MIGAALPLPSLGEDFPARPVTIVVPYPPGGLIDLVARVLQAPLQTALGVPVVAENHTGAGGNVGAEYVAHAAPDGYTLLLANPSLAISPSIYRKLNYRPIEDFAYVGRYGSVPNVLVVIPSLPVKTAQDLIAYARKNPGQLNYGSPGYGTSPQLSSELFKTMTGTYIVHIPFRGGGPAIQALLGGDIQMMIDNIPPQVPLIKAGKVRALAVTSLKRVGILPDVPTMDEIGLKGYEVISWFGLAARAGTPPERVQRLNAALNKASRDPKLREALESRGATIVEGSPEEFLAFVKAETAKFAPVVKRAGVIIE